MFIQLKCENCGSPLNERSKGGYYTCPSCGSKYVFSDDEDGIIDVDKLISEGYEDLEKENYDDAFDKFYLYKEACGVPSYEAYFGYLLSNYDCKNIEALVVLGLLRFLSVICGMKF